MKDDTFNILVLGLGALILYLLATGNTGSSTADPIVGGEISGDWNS